MGVEADVFGERRESVSEYDFSESVSLDEGGLESPPWAGSLVLEMVAIIELLFPFVPISNCSNCSHRVRSAGNNMKYQLELFIENSGSGAKEVTFRPTSQQCRSSMQGKLARHFVMA